jgi:hypothetical protein
VKYVLGVRAVQVFMDESSRVVIITAPDISLFCPAAQTPYPYSHQKEKVTTTAEVKRWRLMAREGKAAMPFVVLGKRLAFLPHAAL